MKQILIAVLYLLIGSLSTYLYFKNEINRQWGNIESLTILSQPLTHEEIVYMADKMNQKHD